MAVLNRPWIASGACASIALGILSLCGCGGTSVRQDAPSDAGGAAGMAGAEAAGGSGTAGSSRTAGDGAAGACVGEDCVSGYVMLADFENGASGDLQIAGVGDSPGNHIVELQPPRGESLHALHLSASAELGGTSLVFHQHHVPFWVPGDTGPGEPFVAVRFWARAGQGGSSSLVVALTGLEREYGDYQADLEAGTPWLSHRFTLTDEWQRYFVLFRGLGREGPGSEAPILDAGGQVLHWLVPRGEPLELWLDDLELGCAGSC